MAIITHGAAAAGGGGGELTDTGTALHPNEPGDSIVIGGTTTANSDIVLNPDGSAVFNDQGAAVDFRIEGDTDANLVVVDGSTDKVSIGVAVPTEKLDVNGIVKATSFAGSGANLTSLPFPWVAHTIDLQAQDIDTFYAVAVRYGAVGSDMHQFYLTMPSQGGGVDYNSHEIYGTVRGSGWQDRPSHSEVTMTYYSSGERSVLGLYHGTTNFDGYVIYLRGGLPVNYTLTINSMSTPVVNTGAYVVSGSTFATKNVSHVDVTGTSANIVMLFDGAADAQNVMKEFSGTVNVGAIDGKLGVNQHYPLYPIHTGGGAYVTTGGVWTDASSLAYKENIVPLSEAAATAAVMALEPQTYNYISDATEKHVGFIAEHVPELVASGDRTGLSPMDIVAALTKVVQRQEVQIQQLLQSAP